MTTEYTNFLHCIGHTDRVYIRCLPPKNTPLAELEARGMTYTTKEGKTLKSVVKGYIDLQTGEFYRRYGNEYKPVTDGWGHLHDLNQQGFGVYFVVGHGGEKNSDITHGSVLFHESDRATFEQQQLEINRISREFGVPTAVVKTRKSLHGYWRCRESIPVENLATLQRRWLQYSNCDDSSLADPAQLMRLPGFDHLAWNPELNDFDRVNCELLRLNDFSYPLEFFNERLPVLDIDRWCKQSIYELTDSDADDRDMRSLAQYLTGFDSSGRWLKAKCPAHDGESSDSLHIDPQTGGFICHAGCSSSAVYNAVRAIAVSEGHRFEVVSNDAELSRNLKESINLKNGKAPIMFGGELGQLLSIASANFNIPVDILNFCLLPILGSRIPSETDLLINPGTDYRVRAIRWCGLVGETGAKKSPIIDTLTQPLNSIQRESSDRFKADKAEFDRAVTAYKAAKPDERAALGEPIPPKAMVDMYFSDFTIESISASIANHQANGYLVFNDELAAFFKSMDAYRGGKGSDRQKWLFIYNGGALKVNRKSFDTIFIPHTSVSILGGIQPSTLENLVKGDESQEDGLWNRFTFVRLPQTKIELFSYTPYSLNDSLEIIYRRLADQTASRHYLSEESKPMCEVWHRWTEDKVFSEQNWLARGTYAKIESIAFRNALILHRTLAAIGNEVPAEYIPASTMEVAIEWTKWELSQTLLEYQMLGLTDDPELARILKFIDKFAGKGWVKPVDTRGWWSTKPKPSFDELKAFMSKVVSLGHAIDNDEPIASSRYQIKILEKSSHSSHSFPETHTHSGIQERLSVVTDSKNEIAKMGLGKGFNVVTTDSHESSHKNPDSIERVIFDELEKSVTTDGHESSHKPEYAVNGHHSDPSLKSVTTSSHSVNACSSNGSSDVVTTVTTFSKDSDLNPHSFDDIPDGDDDELELNGDEIDEDA